MIPERVLGSLAGKRIALTRPRELIGDFEDLVRKHGGTPVIAPAIAIEPPESFAGLDEALRAVGSFDLVVFTSVNAVTAISKRAEAIGIALGQEFRGRIAAVGDATAQSAGAVLHEPEVVSRSGTAESLFSELGDLTRSRVFYPRGNLSNPQLNASLIAAGADVVSPVAYNTVADSSVSLLVDEWESNRLDAVLFASPSAVHSVVAELRTRTRSGTARHQPAIFCIGPTTASAARDAQLEVTGIAEQSTQLALIESAASWFAHLERNND